jgi:hypothetical protein
MNTTPGTAAPQPDKPESDAVGTARSGAGADTALQAMIKKRQMGHHGDVDAPADGAAPLPPKR